MYEREDMNDDSIHNYIIGYVNFLYPKMGVELIKNEANIIIIEKYNIMLNRIDRLQF